MQDTSFSAKENILINRLYDAAKELRAKPGYQQALEAWKLKKEALKNENHVNA